MSVLPEPAGYRYLSVGHGTRWVYAKPGNSVPPNAEPLFTTEQMLEFARSGPTAPVPDNFALRLCHEHEHIGSYTWYATVAQPPRYRCPICEPHAAGGEK